MRRKTAQFTGGEFRHPVAVQRATYTVDAAGGAATVWADVISPLFCDVENTTGKEVYGEAQPGRLRTVQTFNFTTWYRDDIDQTDRLVFDGKLWNIRQINDLDLRHKFLQIVAESGVEQ